MWNVSFPVDAPLVQDLWNHDKPPNVTHVCQVTVELLTGRTHQIRGQFASMGFPLVGDVLYGGAIITKMQIPQSRGKLALQCSSLEFVAPQWNNERLEMNTTSNDLVGQQRCYFELEKAWWTCYLEI
mmetsp:Transcript_42307/g.42873  ORF Transcript_42307/g.42873 Transcript_42307/m.42873 type:complete len:127 (-) Transcript_42307:51-431(-)